MNRPELFNLAVNTGIKSLMNDTLEQGNSCGCFGGNLIANVLKIGINKLDYTVGRYADWDRSFPFWYDTLEDYRTCRPLDIPILKSTKKSFNEGLKQIESTGYTIEEFDRLEKAFEKGKNEFDGLLNVVTVLCEIHEMDDTVKVKTRELFEAAKS